MWFWREVSGASARAWQLSHNSHPTTLTTRTLPPSQLTPYHPHNSHPTTLTTHTLPPSQLTPYHHHNSYPTTITTHTLPPSQLTLYHTPLWKPFQQYLCTVWNNVGQLVGCCLVTKSLNLNNISRIDGGGSKCGIGLLGVTSNKLVTFSRQNSSAHEGLMLFCCRNVTITWMGVCVWSMGPDSVECFFQGL